MLDPIELYQDDRKRWWWSMNLMSPNAIEQFSFWDGVWGPFISIYHHLSWFLRYFIVIGLPTWSIILEVALTCSNVQRPPFYPDNGHPGWTWTARAQWTSMSWWRFLDVGGLWRRRLLSPNWFEGMPTGRKECTFWWFNIAVENHNVEWENPLGMAIFHGYVKLTDGI